MPKNERMMGFWQKQIGGALSGQKKAKLLRQETEMVDIPCLPTQTFFCVGFPAGAKRLLPAEQVSEIMVAHQWEDAKRHFQNFQKVDCLLVLNQEDVLAMEKFIKEAPIAENPLPEPSFLQKMLGHKSASGNVEKIRYFVYGKKESGELQSVVVDASNLPSAFAAAGVEEPEMQPVGGFSEIQISALANEMEAARTGKIDVVNVIAATDSGGAISEALAFLDRKDAKK